MYSFNRCSFSARIVFGEQSRDIVYTAASALDTSFFAMWKCKEKKRTLYQMCLKIPFSVKVASKSLYKICPQAAMDCLVLLGSPRSSKNICGKFLLLWTYHFKAWEICFRRLSFINAVVKNGNIVEGRVYLSALLVYH